MLSGVLLAWAIAAMQDAPRFTMPAAPGDALTAEVFRLDPDLIETQVTALLDDGHESVDDDEAAETGAEGEPEAVSGEVLIQSSGLLNMAFRDGSLPVGPIILYAGPEADHAPDAACRLTRRLDAEIDNSAEATEWCLAFVLKLAPTLVLPPAPVS
ncbi:hypothetical protein D3C80_1167170 [compost metagenome]